MIRKPCELLCLLYSVVIAGGAMSETLPARGPIDSRVRAVPYNSEDVYRLYGFVGYQIDLEFEPGETFVGLGAGDLEGVAFVGQDNHLFLKPKAAKVATNLTVLTSRRHYQFDYTAVATRPRAGDLEVIYALRFLYPSSSQVGRAREIDTELRGAPGAALNLDYWYCGHKSLRPTSASDDGIRTRLRFGARAELPAVFVLNDDGSESLLNFNMEGADLLIQRVARRFILRRGALTGCVVNRGFTGGGERLETGTVSPQVERATRGAGP